jgi:acyl carrier protein
MKNPSSITSHSMGRDDVERRVVEIISANLGIEDGDPMSASLFQYILVSSFKDLDADSLDIYSIMIDIDEELGVQIPDREVQKFRTFADAVEYIVAHLQQRTKSIHGERKQRV